MYAMALAIAVEGLVDGVDAYALRMELVGQLLDLRVHRNVRLRDARLDLDADG